MNGDVRDYHHHDEWVVFFDKQNTVTAVFRRHVYRSADDSTAVVLP